MWDTRESRCAEFEVNLILIDQGGNSGGGDGGVAVAVVLLLVVVVAAVLVCDIRISVIVMTQTQYLGYNG